MVLDELNVQVDGVYKTWKEALPAIRKKAPDFILLDLYLDDNQKGTDLLKEIKDYDIPVIVCTGFPDTDFMNIALEEGVSAFISKPLDKTSLKFHIQKIAKEIEDKASAQNYLIVKDGGMLIKLPFSQIFKIGVDGNYTYIYSVSGKRYVIKVSLKKISEKLDLSKFLRCHRSTIVNLDFITSIDYAKSKINLRNADIVELGNKYRTPIKSAFQK